MRRCSVAKRRALALLLCLLLLLCTACGGQAQEDAGALHCTVRIECSTVLAHMDDLKAGKADIVPSDGVLLPETGGTLATSTGSVLVRLRFQLADGVAEAALTVSDAVLAAADETESLATTTAALTVVNATVQRG